MATTEELLLAYLRSLEDKGYCPKLIQKLEAECINAESDMRRKRNRDLADVAIAQLIPHGIDKVQERFGTSERTGFRRAARGRSLLKTAAILPVGIGT